jgi:signal transduction histidine kinase
MWFLKNKKIVLILIFFYWLILNYVVLHVPLQFFDVPELKAVADVLVVESDAQTPESLESESLAKIVLPDDWYDSKRANRQAWYRASVALDASDSPIWAVYLPCVTHNAAVYINGVWVGQGGSFEEPVSRHHNNPLLFKFSAALLVAGRNQIDIRVKASFPSQGLIDQFYLAPADQLASAFAWKRFLRVDFIRWITIAMYVMGLIVFCFWVARPQDKIYVLFSLQLFIWATHNLNLFIFDIPTSAHFWEAMTMSTLGWTVVAMIFFNHRYVGERNATMEKLALLLAILGMGIFLLPDIGLILSIGYGVWDGFLIIFGSYAIIHLLRVYWLRGEGDVFLMLLVGIPILVFGFHDILMVNHFGDRREGLTIQYSVTPAILLFSWFLIRRFVQSINQAEEMTATLELRVQAKQQALFLQFEQLKSMEQKQILSSERERIMRDMHDGIGGQLVSIASLLHEHSGDVFKTLREKVLLSLADLRFVIDSLDPVLNDLPTLLGMMRTRISEQLETENITLEWDVTALPELANMSPQRSLHIMRIVQEAITNGIKHAGTDRMKLSTSVESGESAAIYIDIIDYGTKYSSIDKHSKKGRGIKNMHYRAEQIGAILTINASEKGTRIRLALLT